MLRLDTLLAPVVIAALSGVSSAQEEPPAAPLFERLDRNGDGRLSADEIPDQRRVFYERLVKTSDKDGDGVITRAEFVEGFARRGGDRRADRPDGEGRERRRRAGQDRPEGARGAQLFKRLDTNGDGKITRDELPERMAARFGRMIEQGDEDGDGALSRRELARAMGAGARDASPEARRRSAPQRPGGRAGALFALLDADRDGKLTRAELKKGPRLLSQLDTDGDQALSPQEILAAPRGPQSEGPPKAKKSRRKKTDQPQGEPKKRKRQGEAKAATKAAAKAAAAKEEAAKEEAAKEEEKSSEGAIRTSKF